MWHTETRRPEGSLTRRLYWPCVRNIKPRVSFVVKGDVRRTIRERRLVYLLKRGFPCSAVELGCGFLVLPLKALKPLIWK